jgi:hypothetical protein
MVLACTAAAMTKRFGHAAFPNLANSEFITVRWVLSFNHALCSVPVCHKVSLLIFRAGYWQTAPDI